MSTRGPAPTAGVAKKVGAGALGGVLLIAGVALLVLPGISYRRVHGRSASSTS